MKTVKYLTTTFLLLLFSVFLLQAQNTEGTDFWLTFGKVAGFTGSTPIHELQIRVVGGSKQTDGKIYFTNLGGLYIPFSINPYEVYDCNLDLDQRNAVYNTVMGKTSKSIHITSSEPVSVYALNHYPSILDDVTNVLPVTALGNEYYHISNANATGYLDAYAVVATKNNTQLFHNGDLVETLNTGQVYYRTSATDMTGSLITSNHPVAFFAVNQLSVIPPQPGLSSSSNLFQQIPPVNTWSKNLFVPISIMDKEVVRIVASQNGTNITQTGGTLRTGIPGAQATLTNLQAGQFVELDLHLDSAGCYIEANHPIGVCSYFRGFLSVPLNFGCNQTQCWISGLEQKVARSLIALFAPVNYNMFSAHYALVVTPTNTKVNTEVSVGGALSTPLQGGNWFDNETAKMSFYSMPLTNSTASYVFSNPAGLIIYGYAHSAASNTASFYYLASSAMRDMQGAFYANDIPYQILCNNPICEGLVNFRTEIEGNLHLNPGRIKWYINGAEEETKCDSLQWSKPFSVGEYEIRMWARFENNDTISKIGTLEIVSCNQDAVFYANNVHHSFLQDTTFCNKTVNFHAEIDGFNSSTDTLKWYINGIEETSVQGQFLWNKPFENGTYEIKMEVTYGNGETLTLTGTLKVQVLWIKMRNVRY